MEGFISFMQCENYGLCCCFVSTSKYFFGTLPRYEEGASIFDGIYHIKYIN